MTYQPPAQPPGGTPPPPPGQSGPWGPPPGGNYQNRPGGIDPKTVNPLDWGILAAGALAFIFSFVSYYSYSVKGFGYGGSLNAWHGFFGWFAMLLALAGSALVALELFAPHVKLPVANRLAALGLYAVASLCVILAIFIVPDPYGVHGFDKGHSWGFWISLIVILAGTVMCLMRLQQTGGALPGPLANLPNIGQHGPQGGTGGSSQPTYGAPPQQGYAAPPQQGYAAPPQQGYAAPPPAAPGQGTPPPPQQPGYGTPPPPPGYGPPQ